MSKVTIDIYCTGCDRTFSEEEVEWKRYESNPNMFAWAWLPTSPCPGCDEMKWRVRLSIPNEEYFQKHDGRAVLEAAKPAAEEATA